MIILPAPFDRGGEKGLRFLLRPFFFCLALLSPPAAMAAFYLKGVAPPHVTLNQIFLGVMPFMALQVVALILFYLFLQIGL